MEDKDWIKSLDNVHDPVELLKIIADKRDDFGYDFYYRDLVKALHLTIKRVIREQSNDKGEE